MNALYDFRKLNKQLTEWGYPEIDFESGFGVIKGVDFEKAYKAGAISFEEDGIYLEYKGIKHRGYMFIKEPWIEMYNSYPKFHIRKCKTIEGFMIDGKFKDRYEFSQHNVNDLIDKTSRRVYKDEVLELCGNCRASVIEDFEIPNTTADFFNSLDAGEIVEEVQIDINGYTKDKEKISRAYRESKGYACESCGIKPMAVIERIYWHTHHADGNKVNNSSANLKCLCILCHANVDDRHRMNFEKKNLKLQIDAFVNKYRRILEECKNPYLS